MRPVLGETATRGHGLRLSFRGGEAKVEASTVQVEASPSRRNDMTTHSVCHPGRHCQKGGPVRLVGLRSSTVQSRAANVFRRGLNARSRAQ